MLVDPVRFCRHHAALSSQDIRGTPDIDRACDEIQVPRVAVALTRARFPDGSLDPDSGSREGVGPFLWCCILTVFHEEFPGEVGRTALRFVDDRPLGKNGCGDQCRARPPEEVFLRSTHPLKQTGRAGAREMTSLGKIQQPRMGCRPRRASNVSGFGSHSGIVTWLLSETAQCWPCRQR